MKSAPSANGTLRLINLTSKRIRATARRYGSTSVSAPATMTNALLRRSTSTTTLTPIRCTEVAREKLRLRRCRQHVYHSHWYSVDGHAHLVFLLCRRAVIHCTKVVQQPNIFFRSTRPMRPASQRGFYLLGIFITI